ERALRGDAAAPGAGGRRRAAHRPHHPAQAGAGPLPGDAGGRRARGAGRAHLPRAHRRGAPGHHDALRVRAGGAGRGARHGAPPRDAGHHPHRQGPGRGPAPGAGAGRHRLLHQAVLPQEAPGPGGRAVRRPGHPAVRGL
ncbi:MAG: hypothetical protein AVDCRST_MAG68-326, partial [uncultured Gemmatimonadetes bacterium]